MDQYLSMLYLWLKSAHLIFVIFWMAGLFMMPRFFVYHQETVRWGPKKIAKWIDREGQVAQDHPVAIADHRLGRGIAACL